MNAYPPFETPKLDKWLQRAALWSMVGAATSLFALGFALYAMQ